MNREPDGSSRPQGWEQASASDPAEDGSQPSLLARLFHFHRRGEEPGNNLNGQSTAQAPLTGRLALNLRAMRAKRVDDVAIPRADIIAVPDDIPFDELIEVFRKTTMTRIPVYHETLDDPVGFVHLKDLALGYAFAKDDRKLDLGELIRPILYVPPSMPLFALLQKMQRERCHMALVIDEYGGVDGLVTFEDLVEQIVGEIDDEHDVADPVPWRLEAPGVYLTLARAQLSEFEEATGVRLLPEDADEDVDTLGGLVFVLSGRVPERGEVIRHPDGHEFEVVEGDARRVKRLRVRLQPLAGLRRAAE
ncbi:MAG: HlyC/CorC family transporter [Alphaproteobacteria bacterium]|nr:MAG: HlyC/CorC family transporter [Alphaproteobacteria bacterium]